MPWTVAAVSWYDSTTRSVELTSQTAVWYRSGKPAVTIRWVLVRDPQGAFDPQALLCTDPTADPTQILAWFVLRWQLEVTFQETRTHLGVETQRTSAWYDKPSPTFVDAIALVRRHLWLASEGFSLSAASTNTQELPVTLYYRMVDSLAYAA